MCFGVRPVSFLENDAQGFSWCKSLLWIVFVGGVFTPPFLRDLAGMIEGMRLYNMHSNCGGILDFALFMGHMISF